MDDDTRKMLRDNLEASHATRYDRTGEDHYDLISALHVGIPRISLFSFLPLLLGVFSLLRSILHFPTPYPLLFVLSLYAQKSIRGSDGSAALYWLARMLTAGEDPLFIARRLVVVASEDVGLADNSALPLVGFKVCFELAHLVVGEGGSISISLIDVSIILLPFFQTFLAKSSVPYNISLPTESLMDTFLV